ncbi:unnamed protein product [Polarella glacialis]|uniref:RING-type domain-containing protein n=1 Tax=Polarella glacialis TaxID=89957 RepID=A0A813DR54_POLGL|nr:unnamed protein product [Polarella glacialis]
MATNTNVSRVFSILCLALALRSDLLADAQGGLELPQETDPSHLDTDPSDGVAGYKSAAADGDSSSTQAELWWRLNFLSAEGVADARVAVREVQFYTGRFCSSSGCGGCNGVQVPSSAAFPPATPAQVAQVATSKFPTPEVPGAAPLQSTTNPGFLAGSAQAEAEAVAMKKVAALARPRNDSQNLVDNLTASAWILDDCAESEACWAQFSLTDHTEDVQCVAVLADWDTLAAVELSYLRTAGGTAQNLCIPGSTQPALQRLQEAKNTSETSWMLLTPPQLASWGAQATNCDPAMAALDPTLAAKLGGESSSARGDPAMAAMSLSEGVFLTLGTAFVGTVAGVLVTWATWRFQQTGRMFRLPPGGLPVKVVQVSVQRFADTCPVQIIGASSEEDAEDADGVCCSICLAVLASGEESRELPCEARHSFHRSCIDAWVLRDEAPSPGSTASPQTMMPALISCPLCRQAISLL